LLLIFITVFVIAAAVWRLATFKLDIEAYAANWPKGMSDEDVAQAVKTLLGNMTLREKISQMSGDGGYSVLLKLGIYVLLLKRFPNIYSGYNPRLCIPPLSFTDGPRGIVIGHATCFPVAMARGASWDPELERRIGVAMGGEARATGANYFAGLCVNLLRHPAWGRAQETYGEDSFHLGKMGESLMLGVQSQQVLVCAKHFAVNSIENSRFYLNVSIDEQALHEIYLPHFKRLVDAGVDSLMSAYNQVNGEYCGHSDLLLQEILRKQWGFRGFVSSDWLWGIYETVKPVRAGMDIEMPHAAFYGRRLLRAVNRGYVAQSIIDDSVNRILTAKIRWITHLSDTNFTSDIIACEAHRNLARESAEQSMVLLKNNGVLPLSSSALQRKKIAVIGELASLACLGDEGSSRVSPPYITTLLQGLREYAAGKFDVLYAKGDDLNAAAAIAARADVVLMVVGYRADEEGENLTSNRKPVKNPKVPRGGDRVSLQLSEQQEGLVAAVCHANPSTVVTVIAGSAVMMQNWQEEAAAILFAGYPGMEGGHAWARILFGDVNPSGKLPFTIPAHLAQLPAFDRWSPVANYEYFHGYGLLDTLGEQAAFSFGFGLSYTQFAVGKPELESACVDDTGTLVVHAHLSNCGDYEGAEVLQCYVGAVHSIVVPTWQKKLCSFKKIFLGAGEAQSIVLRIPVSELARYSTDTKSWTVEKGAYLLWVGTSSHESDLQQIGFTVI
jgi:beta-glucosidase